MLSWQLSPLKAEELTANGRSAAKPCFRHTTMKNGKQGVALRVTSTLFAPLRQWAHCVPGVMLCDVRALGGGRGEAV